jgi:hypothetical protein
VRPLRPELDGQDRIKTLIYQQRSKQMANHSRNGRNGSDKGKNLASETQNLGHLTLKKI